MLPAYPLGGDWRQLRQRAETLLELLRLSHRLSARVEWLSGGEQQRVAIARALINDPEVIIADQPTANLDTALSREFLEVLETLSGRGERSAEQPRSAGGGIAIGDARGEVAGWPHCGGGLNAVPSGHSCIAVGIGRTRRCSWRSRHSPLR